MTQIVSDRAQGRKNRRASKVCEATAGCPCLGKDRDLTVNFPMFHGGQMKGGIRGHQKNLQRARAPSIANPQIHRSIIKLVGFGGFG